MKLSPYFKKQCLNIDRALHRYLPKKNERPVKLHEAMRYAVAGGGKRIRPILALEACRAVGGDERKVLPAACALELIHNYSLVHDDLPCMDDDRFRRGRLSCHAKFGEETAVLAGDALLTLAFQLLSGPDGRTTAINRIASAIGSRGMVGGQAVDMEYQGKELDLPTAEYINTHKSGALIAVSLWTGATLGGGTPKQVENLFRYGKFVGLLFQIVDDIMDGQGYVQALSLADAKKEALRLHRKAKAELSPFGRRGRVLGLIADFVLTRDR